MRYYPQTCLHVCRVSIKPARVFSSFLWCPKAVSAVCQRSATNTRPTFSYNLISTVSFSLLNFFFFSLFSPFRLVVFMLYIRIEKERVTKQLFNGYSVGDQMWFIYCKCVSGEKPPSWIANCCDAHRRCKLHLIVSEAYQKWFLFCPQPNKYWHPLRDTK
jgi:hypothetical protein